MDTIYRGMDRKALDAAYSNSGAVANAQEILDAGKARSRTFYQSRSVRRDLRYGDDPRQRYDWIPSGQAGAPVYVFIHGGYWQICDKEDFAFIAAGPLARGWNVVLAEYTLAPAARMSGIVSEMGGLLDHLAVDRDHLGIAGSPLYVAGHSAGGHLALVQRTHPAVSVVHAISALVDLEPISLGQINDNLQLSVQEVSDYSPLRHAGDAPDRPALLAVGADELPELVRNSTDYALACEKSHQPVGLVHVPGYNHFSVLDDLADLDGCQLRVLDALVGLGSRQR